jgi:signal transduction histidine kinase/ActR/RegA family two-component response regulator
VHSIIAVESDAQGKPVLAVGTVADITEAKDAEADRAYLEGQLRQSQKMETVGQLAGGIAHDFNNLLTAIQGYADMVYDSLDGNESAQADIKQIQLAAESAASLTQQLLAFSRKQIIAPCVLDLNRILAKSEKMVRRIIGEDLDLVWSPGKDLWKTKVDPGQIDQVLVNLAVNARDAVAEGGKLTIETANMVLDEKSCVTCYEPFCGNFVMMAVSDNGCGMDEATMGKAFDPFYTTKSEGQGTGLGLSTVLGIVHQNGGHINIYSEVGRGTSIKIYWPALFGADSIVPAAPEIQELGGTETILLVEDRDMVREVTQRSLERHGYEVIPACDGQAALAACARYGSAIDLLFTDVIMPGLNGRDLHRRICLMIPGLRVLYMSGYTDDAMAHHGVLDNGIHYLQKPFRERAMLQKVREVIEAPQA